MCLPQPPMFASPIRSVLVAHTTLFIDKFGAASGNAFNFFVSM